MGKLEGKVALITGGNRGIGKAIARLFASEGAALTLAARGKESLEETADQIKRDFGVTVVAVAADVSKENEVEVLFERSKLEHGKLDILVNNAGG